MADSLDISRVDPLPGRSPHDSVDALRRPNDREQRKRRQHPPDRRKPEGDEDEEGRQVGTKLDVRA